MDLRRAEDRVIAFVDVLGFARLTEQCQVDPHGIAAYERPLSGNIDEMLNAGENELTRAFVSFHRALKWAFEIANMKHPLTGITFSDSAFVATKYLFQTVAIAIDLVQTLMSERIPVRIGIAHGSFAAVRFRSNVTEDGGEHAAHFLGTGVVRAHSAESCGIKGIRILLHPSAVSLLDDPAHNPSSKIPIVDCSTLEANNRVGVNHEINYWSFKPTAEAKAWHAFQDMWSAAPKDVEHHYRVTGEAISRMRVSLGASALTNLRRRTLPRKLRREPEHGA